MFPDWTNDTEMHLLCSWWCRMIFCFRPNRLCCKNALIGLYFIDGAILLLCCYSTTLGFDLFKLQWLHSSDTCSCSKENGCSNQKTKGLLFFSRTVADGAILVKVLWPCCYNTIAQHGDVFKLLFFWKWRNQSAKPSTGSNTEWPHIFCNLYPN